MSNSWCVACLSPHSGVGVCSHCGWRQGETINLQYLQPGTVVNLPYQVAKVLGYGGFGITYLGWDNQLQIKVAIKEFLPREFAHRDPKTGQVCAKTDEAEAWFSQGLTGFLDEARTLAKFQQHPGIVSVLTFFRAHGTGYMVMEYVEGETLKNNMLRRQRPLSWANTLEVFMQVMDALQAVHQAGLLHRDIAPDNIYCCADGRIKLLDFGAARLNLGGKNPLMVDAVKPGFAAEEQYIEGGRQGPWTDVYGVAASIYYCLTGQAPPPAPARLGLDNLQPPSQLGAMLPMQAEQALLKALSPLAQQRPQTIKAFQQALSEAMLSQAQPILRWPEVIADSPSVNWQRWIWLTSLCLLLALVVHRQLSKSIDQPQPVLIHNQPLTAPLKREAVTQPQEDSIAVDGLRQQQEAALKRFEERRLQDAAQKEAKTSSQELQLQDQMRSLCSEWGATMGCKK